MSTNSRNLVLNIVNASLLYTSPTRSHGSKLANCRERLGRRLPKRTMDVSTPSYFLERTLMNRCAGANRRRVNRWEQTACIFEPDFEGLDVSATETLLYTSLVHTRKYHSDALQKLKLVSIYPIWRRKRRINGSGAECMYQ